MNNRAAPNQKLSDIDDSRLEPLPKFEVFSAFDLYYWGIGLSAFWVPKYYIAITLRLGPFAIYFNYRPNA